MSDSLLNTQPVQDLLRKVSGLDNDNGDARLKHIVHRVVSDLFRTIEEFDVQPNEFWSAMSYLTSLGQANETGLLVPGLGLETFLDMRMDAAERKAGIEGGTPRTMGEHVKGRFTSPERRFRRATRGSTTAAKRARRCSWRARCAT